MGAARSWLGFRSTVPGPISDHPRGPGSQQSRGRAPGPVPKQNNFAFFYLFFFINFSRVFRLVFRVVVGPSRWPWPATQLFAWIPQPGRRPDRHPKASVRHCSLPSRAQSGFNGASATQAGGEPLLVRQCERHAPPSALVKHTVGVTPPYPPRASLRLSVFPFRYYHTNGKFSSWVRLSPSRQYLCEQRINFHIYKYQGGKTILSEDFQTLLYIVFI